MYNPIDIKTTLDNINRAYQITCEDLVKANDLLKELEQREVEIQNKESSLRSSHDILNNEFDRLLDLQESVDFQTQKANIELEREELQNAQAAFEIEKAKFKDSNKEILAQKVLTRAKLDAAIKKEAELIQRERDLEAKKEVVQARVDSFNNENVKLHNVIKRAEKTLEEIRSINRKSISFLDAGILAGAEEEVEEQVKKVAPMIAMLKNIKKEYNE